MRLGSLALSSSWSLVSPWARWIRTAGNIPWWSWSPWVEGRPYKAKLDISRKSHNKEDSNRQKIKSEEETTHYRHFWKDSLWCLVVNQKAISLYFNTLLTIYLSWLVVFVKRWDLQRNEPMINLLLLLSGYLSIFGYWETDPESQSKRQIAFSGPFFWPQLGWFVGWMDRGSSGSGGGGGVGVW